MCIWSKKLIIEVLHRLRQQDTFGVTFSCLFTQQSAMLLQENISMYDNTVEYDNISAIVWVYESIWAIFSNTPFQHFDLVIKMFFNILTVLNQQVLKRTVHVHCFETQLMELCQVWFWVDKRPVFCHLLQQMSSQWELEKSFQGLVSHELTAYLSVIDVFLS